MSSKEKSWKEIAPASCLLKIQRRIHDGRLENLHASSGLREMHQMPNVRVYIVQMVRYVGVLNWARLSLTITSARVAESALMNAQLRRLR